MASVPSISAALTALPSNPLTKRKTKRFTRQQHRAREGVRFMGLAGGPSSWGANRRQMRSGNTPSHLPSRRRSSESRLNTLKTAFRGHMPRGLCCAPGVQAFSAAGAAIVEINKAFRRAGIESVAVITNRPTIHPARRLHHSHKGKAEGRKRGAAVIVSAGAKAELQRTLARLIAKVCRLPSKSPVSA